MRFSQATVAATAFASSALAANHIIEVGRDSSGPALAFNPPVTKAAKGDTISFQFYEPTHTATEGIPDKPCENMSGGFYSGGISTSGSGVNTQSEFVITINDTSPIWFFCSYSDHCQLGMVGVINGPMSDYTKYMTAASKFSGTAGFPGSGKTAVGGKVQAIGASSSPPSSKTSSAPKTSKTSSSKSAGSANSVAGGVIAIAAAAFGIFGL